MADTDNPETDGAGAPAVDDVAEEEVLAEEDDRQAAETEGEEKPEKLDLKVAVDSRSACERHISVTVSRDDIERYFNNEFSELVGKAEVPGFRPGHAPRKLIETRFRKEIGDQVKSSLLMDSIAQVNDEEELSAISEPDVDLDAVELPDEGPMTFEFDLEVRPQFELPKWKGLSLQRPVREFTDEDVDRELNNLLGRYGRLVPHDGPAEVGDYVSTNLTFKYNDQVISSAGEEVIRIRPVLSFRDGKIEKFDELMVGVRPGETRQGEARLTADAPNTALRGQNVTAVFDVLEVKRLELPEMTPQFLEEVGGFELEADLRDAIKDNLKRQLEYHQHRRAREQITAVLTVAADWDLPPEMLKRQSRRELERAVLELRRSSFSEDEIRAHENALRQNSMGSTARAMKEHFILERIAEEEELEPRPEDYDAEISLIADQQGETPRRVRSKLEKGGMMDALRNQVVERMVIDRILSHGEFQEVPYEAEGAETEAIDQAAGGGDTASDIPEAKPDSHQEERPGGPQSC